MKSKRKRQKFTFKTLTNYKKSIAFFLHRDKICNFVEHINA